MNDPTLSGENVTLLKGITLTESLNINNNVTLDLGGNTINIEGQDYQRIIAKGTANVTIKNGNILSNTNYCLYAQGNAILNVNKDLNIEVEGKEYSNDNTKDTYILGRYREGVAPRTA